MLYINTDISNYLEEYIGDGFPASSVRTREFTPRAPVRRPETDDDYRNTVIQYPGKYTTLYLNEKADTIFNEGLDLYHQSDLSSFDEELIRSTVSLYAPPEHRHYSLLGQLLKIPCDLVVCRRQKDGQHLLDLVHLVYPNGWGADNAIGKPFNYFHEHVRQTGGKRVLPTSPKFVDHLIDCGRVYERVGAFSIKTSPILNKHPSKPYKWEFENNEPIYIRFERQVIISDPDEELFYFFIHTNIVDFRARPHLIYEAISNADPNCYVRDKLVPNRDYFLRYLEGVIEEQTKNQNLGTTQNAVCNGIR